MKFYRRYRHYILFNKNIILSGICAFFDGAVFTQFYSFYDHNSFQNSIVTLSFEYCVYLPIFGILYYRDNRDRFINNSSGKRNYNIIIDDVKKLVIAFLVSEIIYSVSKIFFHYQLLMMGSIPPYQSSMIASVISWVIFLVIINLSAKAVHLFKSK